MVAIIEVNQSDELIQRVKLSQTITSFGRSRSNTVILEGKGISRQHCYILQLSAPGVSRVFWLFDGGPTSDGEIIPSTGGIFFNKARISNRRLNHGDVIVLPHGIHLLFHYVSGVSTDGKNTVA
jgi:pSer/pThr/pTyr-binding forkhead associated (FHA) protein